MEKKVVANKKNYRTSIDTEGMHGRIKKSIEILADLFVVLIWNSNTEQAIEIMRSIKPSYLAGIISNINSNIKLRFQCVTSTEDDNPEIAAKLFSLLKLEDQKKMCERFELDEVFKSFANFKPTEARDLFNILNMSTKISIFESFSVVGEEMRGMVGLFAKLKFTEQCILLEKIGDIDFLFYALVECRSKALALKLFKVLDFKKQVDFMRNLLCHDNYVMHPYAHDFFTLLSNKKKISALKIIFSDKKNYLYDDKAMKLIKKCFSTGRQRAMMLDDDVLCSQYLSRCHDYEIDLTLEELIKEKRYEVAKKMFRLLTTSYQKDMLVHLILDRKEYIAKIVFKALKEVQKEELSYIFKLNKKELKALS